MPKSAKGAHGGGVEYDEVEHKKEFEIADQGYVKNKKEPEKTTEAKVDSHYSESFSRRLDKALRDRGLIK